MNTHVNANAKGDGPAIRLLLVDDEEDFRQAAGRALERRGFTVLLAESGEAALSMLADANPDLVILDLRMPGLSGIETLDRIRERTGKLPVLILTGHGTLQNAFESIHMSIVDFLQKPVDMDQLAARIRRLLDVEEGGRLRERGVAELMVSPDRYPRLYEDEPIERAVSVLWKAFNDPDALGPVRSARLYDRRERFLGLLRFSDLLEMVIPPFLGVSPYSTYFTGMLLAQCKVLGKQSISDLLTTERVSVNETTPLMEAIHVMVDRHLITLPVLRRGKLVGVLRETDIVGNVLENMGGTRGS